jgi:single-stranded-DNA-specific exonuclease
VPEIAVDDELDLSLIDAHTIDQVRQLEPYGQGNPEPIFMARGVEVNAARVVGGKPLLGNPGHLKLALRSPRGGRPHDAIGFGMGHLPITAGARIDVLYTPEINVWNGQASLQLRLRDLKGE